MTVGRAAALLVTLIGALVVGMVIGAHFPGSSASSRLNRRS